MFMVLTYSLFWLELISFGVIALGILRLPMDSLPSWIQPLLTILGSWMASLSALIVTQACEGWAGVRRLFSQFFQFRLPLRWYLAALIPFGLGGAAVGLYRLFGGTGPGGASLTPALLAWLVVYNFLTGPTGEEPGWRGFVLPRLLQRYSPLKASLLMGLAWGFWHLPLWLTSGLALSDLLPYILFFLTGIIALSLLMVWVYRQTSPSLAPMVILHFAFNFSVQFIGPSGLGLGAQFPLFYWLSGLAALVAIIVWGAKGLSMPAAARPGE
jgi:uncharacterized protein